MNKLKSNTHIICDKNGKRGAVAIIVAIVLGVLIGIAALAVDVGYLMVTRNELQNIADTAALAAVRQLGVIYEPMKFWEIQSYVCNPDSIIEIARDIALKNRAAGKNIEINENDVVIGDWDTHTKVLTPTLNSPDAVGIMARRDATANASVATFFARMFGKGEAPVSAWAVASISSQNTATEGALTIPVAISRCKFESGPAGFCGDDIIFYPTAASEAGWHCYLEKTASASTLRDILIGLTNGTYVTPEVIAGETELAFSGGTIGSVFDEIKALFDAMRIVNDGKRDKDDNDETWTTSVAVYDIEDCEAVFNPTQTLLIVGFATVIIDEVVEQPEKKISGKIECGLIESGRGGGNYYGVYGSIPGLVQ